MYDNTIIKSHKAIALTTFKEAMPKEADKQAHQANDREENLCRDLS